MLRFAALRLAALRWQRFAFCTDLDCTCCAEIRCAALDCAGCAVLHCAVLCCSAPAATLRGLLCAALVGSGFGGGVGLRAPARYKFRNKERIRFYLQFSTAKTYRARFRLGRTVARQALR